MKEIVRITVNKEVTTEKPVLKKDESGAEIKVLEKVTEKVPQNYILAKPSFSLKQESTLYYESVVAECIKRGIFSTIQLRKRFVDDGGILGTQEKKSYEDAWVRVWNIKSDLKKLEEDPEKNKDLIKSNTDEMFKILGELQSIEERSGNSLLYEHTAEKIASDRTVVWWMLFLAYKDNNGKFEPVFGTGKYEDKLKIYDEFENRGDTFETEVTQKLLIVSSAWAFNKAETQTDFDLILSRYDEQNFTKPKE